MKVLLFLLISLTATAQISKKDDIIECDIDEDINGVARNLLKAYYDVTVNDIVLHVSKKIKRNDLTVSVFIDNGKAIIRGVSRHPDFGESEISYRGASGSPALVSWLAMYKIADDSGCRNIRSKRAP
jgi:hypothetical protein